MQNHMDEPKFEIKNEAYDRNKMKKGPGSVSMTMKPMELTKAQAINALNKIVVEVAVSVKSQNP